MIFSIGDHIQQIIDGTKTSDRWNSDKPKVGDFIPIRTDRCTNGSKLGEIKILSKTDEYRKDGPISAYDAKKEGGYTPKKFEQAFLEHRPRWKKRTVIRFKFYPDPILKYCDNPDCKIGGNRTIITTAILRCFNCGQSQQN